MSDAPLDAELRIAPDHASFAGHFPGSPIVPGAVLLDEALYEIERSRGLDLVQWRIAAVKFLQVVRPGDPLTLTHAAPNDATIRFAIRRGNDEVVSGTLSAMPRSNPDGL